MPRKSARRSIIISPSKVKVIPNLLAKDKLQHFVAGVVIAAFLYPFVGHYALLAAVVIGLIKEYVIDVIFPLGNPDIWDAVATALGGLAVTLIVIMSGYI